jgi:hypothetical protein
MATVAMMTLAGNKPRVVYAQAFDNEGGWKKDADGKLAADDKGNPIWVKADNTEQSVQGDTIARLNHEAKTNREAAEKAQGELDKFKVNGKLLDPTEAAKAVETVKKIDAKTLIDAGEVDKVREQIKAEYTTQLTEKDGALKTANDTINTMRIDGLFTGSEFVRDRVAVPADMFRDSFGKNVKIGADGKPEFFDRAGNRIMSKKSIGEFAQGDEAFELLVDAHPQKDTILRAADKSGTGNNGNGGNRGTGRVIRRGDFEKMTPHDQMALSQAVTKGEAQLID